MNLNTSFEILIPREMTRNGFVYIPIELSHAAAVLKLPFHHRDPFDRMLVAQAMTEEMAIVSADSTLESYQIRRIW